MAKKKAAKKSHKKVDKTEITHAENSSGLETHEEEMLEQEEMEEEEENILEEDFEGPKEIGGFTILGEFKAKDKKKVERFLPDWLRLPVMISDEGMRRFEDITSLDSQLILQLKENGLENCFPVQWTVIPELLAQSQHGVYAGDAGLRPRDICVSAPTGSGKTLTFVLPIVQALKNRVVPHVRALVILPVRDLAIQVYRVFKQYIQGTPLKVVLLAGKTEFHLEETKLVQERMHTSDSQKWASLADIVVATRGRLLDHLHRTEGFDLTHLRYLVIDEADRQMEDVYDNWLSQVEAAAYTPRPGACSPYDRTRPGPLNVASTTKIVMHVQKLLFSATLSQNPEKLEQMNLFMPLLFATAPGTSSKRAAGQEGADAKVSGPQSLDKFSTPALLKEQFIVCKTMEKPLVLFDFVLNKKYQQVLCFTSSVESTHRLYLLAKQMEGLKVAELSSGVHTEKRERIIRKFARGDVHLLICSDVMTRGMDIDNVKYVISYDAPTYIETYIHRIGRTARAKKSGTAITMVEGKEMFHFKKMLRDSGRWDKLKRINLKHEGLEALVPQFQQALKMLPVILKEQRRQQKNS